MIKLKAYAKINLALSITGKRDDGYHFIDTIMQNISLCDYITIKEAKDITVKCDGYDIENEKNIAFKAAKVFFEETKIKSGAKITIKKEIPLAAGLGGGSADAAAVLLGLNEFFEADLSDSKLEEIAIRLGADVPFFIKGGTQRAEGIGEILTVLPSFKKGYFVLARADKKPSTAEMYKRLDSENHQKPDVDLAIEAIKNQDLIKLSSVMDNSFISVWSESKLKTKLLEYKPLCVSLSGSGPTWFALFDDISKAKKAFEELKAQKIESYFAEPVNFGVSVE